MLPLSPLRRLTAMPLLVKINVFLILSILVVAMSGFASAAGSGPNSFSIAILEQGPNTPIANATSEITVKPGPTGANVGSGVVTGGTNSVSFTKTGNWNVGAHFTVPSGYTYGSTSCTQTPDVSNNNYLHITGITSASSSCYVFLKKDSTTPPPGSNATFTVKMVDDTGKPLNVLASSVSVNPDSLDSTNDTITVDINSKSEVTIPYTIKGSSRIQVNNTYPIVGWVAEKDECAPLPETNSLSVGVPGRIFLTGVTQANESCTIHFKKDPDAGARLTASPGVWPMQAKPGDTVKFTFNVTNQSATKVSGIEVKVAYAEVSASVPDLEPGKSAGGEIEWTIPPEVTRTVDLYVVATGTTASGKLLTSTDSKVTLTIISDNTTTTTRPGQTTTTTTTRPGSTTTTTRPGTTTTTQPGQTTTTTRPGSTTTTTGPGTTTTTQPGQTTTTTHPGSTTTTNPGSTTTSDTRNTVPPAPSTSSIGSTTVPVSVLGINQTRTQASGEQLPFTGSQTWFMLWFALVLVNGGYLIHGSMKYMKSRKI